MLPDRRMGKLADDLPADSDGGGGGGVIDEVLEVLEGPDDLFVPRNLDQLRIVSSGVAVADDDISTGQQFE